MRRVLGLDATLAGCSAACWADGLVARLARDGERGHAAALPAMARSVLAAAGWAPSEIDLVAVGTGPGSFTGLRAAIALAQGLARARHIPLCGVPAADAIRAASDDSAGWPVWVASFGRRGHVHLDRTEGLASVPLDALPHPSAGIALAGDAAAEVASRMAARGDTVKLLRGRGPDAREVAMLAARGHCGPVVPLYVDPPLTSLARRS